MIDSYDQWSMEAFEYSETLTPPPVVPRTLELTHLMFSPVVPTHDNQGKQYSNGLLRLIRNILNEIAGGSTTFPGEGDFADGDAETQHEPILRLETMVPFEPWMEGFVQDFLNLLQVLLNQKVTIGALQPIAIKMSSQGTAWGITTEQDSTLSHYVRYARELAHSELNLAGWLRQPEQADLLASLAVRLQAEVEALTWSESRDLSTNVAIATVQMLERLTNQLFAPDYPADECMALARGDKPGPYEPEERFWLYARLRWFSGWTVAQIKADFGDVAIREVEPSLRVAERVVETAWLKQLPYLLTDEVAS